MASAAHLLHTRARAHAQHTIKISAHASDALISAPPTDQEAHHLCHVEGAARRVDWEERRTTQAQDPQPTPAQAAQLRTNHQSPERAIVQIALARLAETSPLFHGPKHPRSLQCCLCLPPEGACSSELPSSARTLRRGSAACRCRCLRPKEERR